MESVDTADLGFRVVVDYAHTAESMENVLQTLRDLNPQRLITCVCCVAIVTRLAGQRWERSRLLTAIWYSSHQTTLELKIPPRSSGTLYQG